MRIGVVRTVNDGLDRLVQAIDSHEEFELTGTASTGSEISTLLRRDGTDVVLFSTHDGDLVRTVRRTVGVSVDAPPLMVAGAAAVSTPVMAWALLCGFHGLIPRDGEPRLTLEHLSAIVEGRGRLLDAPEIRELSLTPGLLAKQLTIDDPRDVHIADLVGAGLTDETISQAMDLSIQVVRNRVEHLLHSNGLAYRTQLAVVRAASLTVREFS